MKNYIGIDLGTTNSVICSYDGSETNVLKSPEQNDVTPSAIFFDRRGNRYVGKRAYDSAPHSPGNSAVLFKRLMGTSTPIQLPAVNLTWTPEECSAEVLKVLFGYLPEEIRRDQATGTVISVPAAFNQMQKDATLQAAQMAGLGQVALIQEPVAAVMSVMRKRNVDGMFLIFDLGGGTLDIAIAESIGGRVNLLAHGGIARCGGRDFDRALIDNVIKPWLFENFDLPEDFSVNPAFRSLVSLSAWAAERAKIELSVHESSVISLSENEARLKDLSGNDIYLDIPLLRESFDQLIAKRVSESIEAARDTLSQAGLSPHDLERIVFVGGPTNYKPLRDKVAFELGISGGMDVNPMTAVAEGASLFSESIDWDTHEGGRKSTRGGISSGGDLNLSFNFTARTPTTNAKIAVQLTGHPVTGYEFQIDSVDTGWTSGRRPLMHGTVLDVTLTQAGENSFKAFVFDATGSSIALEQDRILITRTAATIDSIPASHSVGIEVVERLGGPKVLDYLVRSGDSLPIKGKRVHKATESLKSGAPGSINIVLWEGEIEDPIADNRFIGTLKITGSDFDDGVIPAGAELECDYQILDSGNIILEVSVPCIGSTFHSDKNFYSRQEGQLDYTSEAGRVTEEGEQTLSRVEAINEVLEDPKLDQAREKLELAASLNSEESDMEKTQEAMEQVLEARRILAQVRKNHLKEIRQMDLDAVVESFESYVRENARPSEQSAFDSLSTTAQRSIDKNENTFEHYLEELRGKNSEILWRQDWFVLEQFKFMNQSPHLFADKHRFEELTRHGVELMRSDEFEGLREIVVQLFSIRIGSSSQSEGIDVANIMRG